MIISAAALRRYLLYKHGLLGPHRYEGEAGVVAFIRDVGCIQYDPVDVCGRNADLTLQARVADYAKPMLQKLLYQDRVLVDGFDKMMSISHRDDWHHLACHREHYAHTSAAYYQPILGDLDAAMAWIDTQPYVSTLPHASNEHMAWGYGSAPRARAILELLYYQGRLCIHHKEGTRRYFAPRTRFFEADEPVFADMAARHEWFVLRRIGAVGALWSKQSAAWLGVPAFKAADRARAFARLMAKGLIVALAVPELGIDVYIRHSDLPVLAASAQVQDDGRIEFIAPLDPLMWDRRFIDVVFGFAYTWEIYTPKVKRQYGHYVLPILVGDELVGRIEMAVTDKKLYVDNVWFEPGKRVGKAALNQRIRQFARFNEATLSARPAA